MGIKENLTSFANRKSKECERASRDYLSAAMHCDEKEFEEFWSLCKEQARMAVEWKELS